MFSRLFVPFLMSASLAARAVIAQSITATHSVPFQRAPSPYVVIGVPIKGQGCTSLLFDTGTNLSIVSPDLAARLAIHVDRPVPIASVAGRTTARLGIAEHLGFAETTGGKQSSVVITDVTELRPIVGNINGIFGQSLLGASDYFLDYKQRRLTIAASGALTVDGGTRVPLEWSEGRPAITREVRSLSTTQPIAVTLVLDSGIDRLTLFASAATRLAAAARVTSLVSVDSPLGRSTARAASIFIRAIDRDVVTTTTLLPDIQDRQEDGLIPTSLFRSVFISAARDVVVLDGRLRTRADLQTEVECAN